MKGFVLVNYKYLLVLLAIFFLSSFFVSAQENDDIFRACSTKIGPYCLCDVGYTHIKGDNGPICKSLDNIGKIIEETGCETTGQVTKSLTAGGGVACETYPFLSSKVQENKEEAKDEGRCGRTQEFVGTDFEGKAICADPKEHNQRGIPKEKIDIVCGDDEIPVIKNKVDGGDDTLGCEKILPPTVSGDGGDKVPVWRGDGWEFEESPVVGDTWFSTDSNSEGGDLTFKEDRDFVYIDGNLRLDNSETGDRREVALKTDSICFDSVSGIECFSHPNRGSLQQRIDSFPFDTPCGYISSSDRGAWSRKDILPEFRAAALAIPDLSLPCINSNQNIFTPANNPNGWCRAPFKSLILNSSDEYTCIKKSDIKI